MRVWKAWPRGVGSCGSDEKTGASLMSVAAVEEEEDDDELPPPLPLRGPPTFRPGAAQNPEVVYGVRQSETPRSRRQASIFLRD